MLKCDSKAEAKALTNADIATCSSKPDASLVSGYSKADAKGPCGGTAADAQRAISNCESASNTAVGNAGSPRTASKCDSKKIAAMSKKLSGLLACDSKESAKGADQSACRSAVASKFTAAIGKLASATDCSNASNAATLEPVIDSCRASLAAALTSCSKGFCDGGAFCDSGQCPNPLCYPGDSPPSLLMCGGLADPCCGVGTCIGGGYCEGPDCSTPVCYDASAPISQVMCGGALHPNCGVGTCVSVNGSDSYCDGCLCYAPGSAVSHAFCDCHKSACGEITAGCGVGACRNGSYCDGCLCYAPDSNVSQRCCYNVETTFDQIYVPDGSNTYFHHAIAGIETSDRGFVLVGGLSDGLVARTDAYGGLLWFSKSGQTWAEVVEVPGGFVLAGVDGRLTQMDGSGNIVWSRKLAGALYGLTVAGNGDLVTTGELGGDVVIARVDSTGTYVWAQTVGGAGADEGSSIIPQGSGFLVLANTKSFGAGSQDLWLISVDGSGNVLWTKTFGGTSDEGSTGALNRSLQHHVARRLAEGHGGACRYTGEA